MMSDATITQHLLDRATDELRREIAAVDARALARLVEVETRLIAALNQHVVNHKEEHMRVDQGFSKLDAKLDKIDETLNVWRGQLRIILGVLGVVSPILTALLLRVF